MAKFTDSHNFNPRPHMGDDWFSAVTDTLRGISIHVPTWGTTLKLIFYYYCYNKSFIHLNKQRTYDKETDNKEIQANTLKHHDILKNTIPRTSRKNPGSCTFAELRKLKHLRHLTPALHQHAQLCVFPRCPYYNTEYYHTPNR